MNSPLVSAPELRTLLAAPDPPTLLDVRWRLGGPPGIEDYRRGHIPGACFVDLDAELADPPGTAGRHPLPATSAFERAMRRCGVRATHPVVVYDADNSTAAARAWWVLGYFGHPAVRVLDGGFRAWTDAGGEVSTSDPTPAPGDFTAHPGGRPILDAASSAALAQRGVLLDARAPERFRGETEPIDPVAGHIPGARNLDTRDNVDPTGHFLPADQLRARFAAAGAVPGAEVGTYCGSGVTAAHELLALELAGIPAALYVGSWSEWITDPARPIALGGD